MSDNDCARRDAAAHSTGELCLGARHRGNEQNCNKLLHLAPPVRCVRIPAKKISFAGNLECPLWVISSLSESYQRTAGFGQKRPLPCTSISLILGRTVVVEFSPLPCHFSFDPLHQCVKSRLIANFVKNSVASQFVMPVHINGAILFGAFQRF